MSSHRGMSLKSIVAPTTPTLPILPLIHSTGADAFLSLTETKTLSPSLCPVYKEQLLYFFYGRPAYRPNSKVLNTSLPVFRPVCILLSHDAVSEPKRVAPLDTGAFHAGLFTRHLAPHMAKDCFYIDEGVKGAAKFVSAFFETNKRYYLGRLKHDIHLKSTDLIAQSYCSIVSDTGISEVDDRRSTIELQIDVAVPLTSQTVLAVALPEDFLEDDDLSNLILNIWLADIITYDIYSDRPSADVREIIARVKDYLSGKGYLP